MSKELIVVESPTKARTLSRFFGNKYDIVASFGHVRDLPKSKFGIDTERNFAPDYNIPKEKLEIVKNLRDKFKKAKELILATDPDREGEAIAWHITELLRNSEVEAHPTSSAQVGLRKARNSKLKISGVKRIVFHEITSEAVSKALQSPRSIDLRLVNSQQARRILDRVVGYRLSPILWRKVRRGLSAGRVQSIALRFVVDREREVEQFEPEEYWSIAAELKSKEGDSEQESFIADLVEFRKIKIKLENQKQAGIVVEQLKDAKYVVESIVKKEAKKSPHPPFTTSTIVQNASNKYGFSSKKTMKLAQDLYEEGLITYMRTDSVNFASSAISAIRDYVRKKYGKNFLSEKPRIYRTKSKLAQEAHEAIRPTSLSQAPETLKKKLDRDHLRLYQLIWQRSLSTQMADAVYDQTSVDIKAKECLFRANGSMTKFPGWLSVYRENDKQDKENQLPELSEKEELNLVELTPEQHFTEPPPRYTEATLIKELEEKGIGRPSTYAPIIATIQERRYVEKIDRRLQPTPLGAAVCDFLLKNFPSEMDADFTAKMEDRLDEIAKGTQDWVPVVADFYKPFNKQVEKVNVEASRVKIFAELSDQVCELCGKPMLIRYGRFGRFLACSGFPQCKGTKSFEEKVEAICPECQSQVVVRSTKKRRKFYGCSSYPKCHWMSWYLPKQSSSDKSQMTNQAQSSNT